MRIDVTFISIGLAFLICGMVFGMWMGVRQDFQFADAHAHWNLLGFVVPTFYGLIYRTYPALARSRLAWPQLIAHFVGVPIFVLGIVLASVANNEVVVAVGSTMVTLATLAFGFLFITTARST